EVGLNPDDPKAIEQLKDFYKVIHIMRSFHEALGSILTAAGDNPRDEQRRANQAVRESVQGASEPGLIGSAVTRAGNYAGDVWQALFTQPGLSKQRMANQVVDFRILQIKEVLFRREIAALNEKLKTVAYEDLSESEKKDLAYFRNTTIDER